MRLGLVARADKTGLGAQTWTFWRNMRPDATLVVDLSHCSGQQPDLALYDRGDVEVWKDRNYPSTAPVPDKVVERFLSKVDVVFGAETFYNYWLINRARQLGVRTVLQPNYEFLDYLLDRKLPEPDVLAFPSTWHLDDVRRAMPRSDVRHLPVPVDAKLLPFRQRLELNTILHTAGTPAMEDRNGTMVLIEAMRQVRTPVTAVIRTLKPLPIRARHLPTNVIIDDRPAPNYWDLYDRGDMLVIPRKFGGLCLPQQEALACGMPVLMTDVAPQNEVLPADLLVPAIKSHEVMTRAMIDIHQTDPVVLASRIDWLHEHPDRFAELSAWAGEWAADNSWEALRPLYEATLTGRWPEGRAVDDVPTAEGRRGGTVPTVRRVSVR